MINLFNVRAPDVPDVHWSINSLTGLAALLPARYAFVYHADSISPPDALYVWMSHAPGERLGWAFSQPEIVDMLKRGIPLVLDDSAEMGYRSIEGFNYLLRVARSHGIEHAHFILLMQNENGAALADQVFRPESGIKVTVVTFHYWMHYLRMHVSRETRSPAAITHRYSCLNYKLRPHRAVILGWLQKNGYLERGIVSSHEKEGGADVYEASLRHLLPSFVEEGLAGAQLDLPKWLGRDDPLVGIAESVPYSVYDSTGFCLMTETDFDRDIGLRFTEKVLKPMAAGQAFVLAGGYKTLALLRSYGFKTFSPIIDESYDEIVDPDARMTAVLAEARLLLDLDEASFAKVRDWVRPAVEHNVEHFFNGLPAIMERQHESLLQAVKQARLAR